MSAKHEENEIESSESNENGSSHESDYETDTESSSNDDNNEKQKKLITKSQPMNDKDDDVQSSAHTDNAEEYESDSSSGSTAESDEEYEDESTDTGTAGTDDDNDATKTKIDKLTKKENDNSYDEEGSTSSSSSTELESADDASSSGSDMNEEAEPQLKYQRLGGGVTQMMINDSASSLECHPRFLVLGMKSGTVYVLDPHGDIIKQYRPHLKNAVNDISIDQSGDHVATCSKDGRVVIRDIFKDVQTVHNFRNQDLLSIELHPNYGTSQMFVTGGRGQQLLLRSIGFFRSDNKVLHSGEGPIYCISWQCELIAWANDRGVKIFDISDHKPIAHINRSNRGSPDPEKYHCSLCWEDRETLLIGWGDWVKIGRVRTVRTQSGQAMKEVHVTNVFITDFYICGIAPFKEHLILLAFLENDSDDDESDESDHDDEDSKDENGGGMDAGVGKSKPPELRIVSRRGEWIATDALPINQYRANQAKNYKLIWAHDDFLKMQSKNDNSVYLDPYNQQKQSGLHRQKERRKCQNIEDETFYIVSPSDIVASLPRTVEDHIKWLWQRGEYERAWRQSVLYSDDLIRSKLNSTSLGEEFLKYVLEEDVSSHHRFGDLCREICAKSIHLWEKWIDCLAECEKLDLIIDVIPINAENDGLTLSQRCYELVLIDLIKNDKHKKFLDCILSWNKSLYNGQRILAQSTNRLNAVRSSDHLIRAMAELYKMENDFERALELYLQLKSHLLSAAPQNDLSQFDVVCLLKDNEQYKYLQNQTIAAMIRRDEEQKYEEKLEKMRKNKKKFDEDEEEEEERQKNEQKLDKKALKALSDAVFSMIIEHKLWSFIGDCNKLISLIELDVFVSAKLFVEYRDEIHKTGANFVIECVTLRMSQIDNEQKMNDKNTFAASKYKTFLKFFMYLYLHKLIGCNQSGNDQNQYPEFHDWLVALYAEFDSKSFANFVAISHHIKFDKALKVCSKRLSQCTDKRVERHLNECYVFILNRMGNFVEALQVILIKLGDVEKAVKFVEKEGDKTLWNHLIERTLRDAKSLMPKLLDAVKGHPNVDAMDLIQKIPDKLKIIGLKEKISAIFEEYSREKLLTKGSTDILRSDCLKLSDKLYSNAAKGVFVDCVNAPCIICGLPLKMVPRINNKKQQQQQQKFDVVKEEEEIGANRISIGGRKGKKEINATKNFKSTSTLPSIKIFHCAHFYHVDCYREAQFDANIDNSLSGDNDKCLICFSAKKLLRKY